MIIKKYFIAALFCGFFIYVNSAFAEEADFSYKEAQLIKSLIGNYYSNDDPESRESVIDRLKELSGNSPVKLKRFLEKSFPFPAKKPAIYEKLASFEGLTGKYYLYVPKGYDGKKPMPVIVSLHGVGEGGAAFMKLWLKYSNHNNKYIFLCPRYDTGYWWQHNAGQLILNALRQTSLECNIDTNRIYLTGFSSGAHGAWHNSILHPDLYAGVVVMSGECPIPSQMANLKHAPVCIIHGDNDDVIPVEAARDAKARLEKLKYDFNYIEVPGMVHAYPHSRFNEILEWMEKKQRNPYPESVKFIGNARNTQSLYWLKIESAVNSFELPDLKPYSNNGLPAGDHDYPVIEGEIDGNDVNIICEKIKNFKVFMNEDSFEANMPVNVFVNGKLKFSKVVKPKFENLFENMEQIFDRNRLCVYCVEVKM